ncbi:M1 family metallopeptidase [Terrimonas rubra]|uniref:M1 family metallopeptidase n=1 Tax=Terrimonas rubra TaxID=1035890 RepID=A0ABW6A6N1_9BACT
MKRFTLTIPALLVYVIQLAAQHNYWQQEVNYTIRVKLDDTKHSLKGNISMDYTNHSPDTLHYIWFHIWPNAYKNDKTAFSDQQLQNDNTRFYFSGDEEKGYINQLDFKVDGEPAATTDHPQHIDILKLVLNTPLAPGKTIQISTPFHVKLPANFSRSGHEGNSYQVTQWYPKPAVYDKDGWHAMPYVDQGEFYSEFGKFDVTIEVPANYVVAATGNLQQANEKEWLKGRRQYTWKPVTTKEKNRYGQVKTIKQLYPASSPAYKTLRYTQDNVHDFAWFADKRFRVAMDSCRLASGRVIETAVYYLPEYENKWVPALQYTKNAVRFYSDAVGEYPYDQVSVVQGPMGFGGGMEYPTITLITPQFYGSQLDRVIAHEVGHNWFYGILGSNERAYPWLDEGVNSYYEKAYMQYYYPGNKAEADLYNAIVETKAVTKTDQPIHTASEDFSGVNYSLIAYEKTASWLKEVETVMGTTAFNQAMQQYFKNWQFKHPQPEDFRNSIQRFAPDTIVSTFDLLDKKGLLPQQQKRKGLAFITPFSKNKFTRADGTRAKTTITLLPAIGINSYDKFMIGAAVTNAFLPPNPFEFFAAPMYATGSKRFTGIGYAQYSLYPEKTFYKIRVRLNAASFSMDDYIDADNRKTIMGFTKLAPELLLVLKEKNANSPFYKYIQFKSFFIKEQDLHFYRDTVISNNDDTTISTKYRKVDNNTTLLQLKLGIENNRKLYPYQANLVIEQGKNFVRAAFTGNYFLNYPWGGGLRTRLFAGKFFYTGDKTFAKQAATDRYHLNMTGANGYEDYTYSDYFIGRNGSNNFQGWTTQQIMVRDGGFKVRTDLLSNKIGRSDDWLSSLNFSSTLFKSQWIPIRLFADIGTYSGGWKKEAETDKFLYNAGLQLSFLKETINIYFPLLYSSVYKDYILSTSNTTSKLTRFLKTVSFSIDVSNFSLRKINRNLLF